MTTQISKHNVDEVQGIGANGRRFGYVHGEDGGFFFTWMPTLEDTLESVEVDEVDGDGGLSRGDVVDFLESHLPETARGKSMWSAE